MDFVEQSIKTYNGLSTETKPTAAGGSNIPNGSRFREIDAVTSEVKTFFYNISDDTWYEDNRSVSVSGDVSTVLYDSAGNPIHSSIDSDGDYHLGTAIIQEIISSAKNYTDTNLTAGETFTGTADETFGVSGIQVFHTADQDCIIYIDQSMDSSFADSTQTITDYFECLANQSCSRTFISVSPYYRLRVKNNGLSSTTKIITATGMAPVISPLPRSLTTDDRLKTESTIVGRENTDRHLWVSPTNSISVNENVRLVGTNFDGTTKDTNFWTETITNNGSVVQNGEIKLQTNTTANGTAKYVSVRRARFVVGAALLFQGIYKFNDALEEDNIRRCGAYDGVSGASGNGFYFELDGSVFSVGSRSSGTESRISSGSFNGNIGPSFTPSVTTYYNLKIEYTPLGAFYYVNGKLLHKSVGGHLTRYLTLPITMENINDNNNATAVVFDCLGVTISRQGKLKTNPTSKYAVNGTTILKVGAGDLHRITITDTQGTLLAYDGLSAAGVLIANLDASKTVGTMEFGCPFSDGLTVVVAGTPKMTVIYE